jgi:hypothetical protein
VAPVCSSIKFLELAVLIEKLLSMENMGIIISDMTSIMKNNFFTAVDALAILMYKLSLYINFFP